jgi:hypothetical protein
VLRDDVEVPAPPSIIGAVALGVAPLPFLAVYAILFLVHGTVHPVVPPDIGGSKNAELVAGLIALAAFVVVLIAEFWLMDGRRRWPYALAQLATLGTAVYFLVDRTTGPVAVPLLLAVTSLAGLVLAFAPPSWDYVACRPPAVLSRRPQRQRRTAGESS